MNKNEIKIISQLLEEASRVFSNHGCNDFELENTDENWALIRECYIDNESLEDFECLVRPAPNKPITFYDWWLMAYLAQKLSKSIE
jgi:hypothetical protein